MKRRPCLFVKTTLDEFELPEHVAGSVAELARMTGKTVNTVAAYMTRKQRGWHKIYLDEEGCDD